MNIYVPYTVIQPATQICLLPYQYSAHKMTQPDSYPNLLQKIWDKGQPVIIVEHDTVFWSGALEEIWNCKKDWCVYGHNKEDDLTAGCAYLGCAKLSANLMKQIPNVWKEMNPRVWSNCDCHLSNYARKHGFEVHQHYPSVVNANPSHLEA